MKAWSEEFSNTCLAQPAVVKKLDRRVRDALVRHRRESRPRTESVAPWSVDLLVREIERLGKEQRWQWCTAAICLLAELLFCSKEGGTFATLEGRLPLHLKQNIEALRVLRNAVFHPAHQSGKAGSGEPPIQQLVHQLELGLDRTIADKLKKNWSYLAARPVTSFALRMLNSAVRFQAKHLGIPVRN